MLYEVHPNAVDDVMINNIIWINNMVCKNGCVPQ